MSDKSDNQPYTVVLATDSWPFGGDTEGSFVVPEIEALSRRFDRVIVMPSVAIGPEKNHALPANVEICRDWIDSPECRRKWMRLRYLLSPRAWRAKRSNSRSEWTFVAAAIDYARFLRRWIAERSLPNVRTLYYPFWFDLAACGMALVPDIQYVVRAHGHDVYTHRGEALRRLVVEGAVGVYAVSDCGADFLRRSFPGLEDKINVSKLGCDKLFPEAVARANGSKSGLLTLLSVSRVDDNKRVNQNHELAKALAVARPGTQVRWIHVGDGPLMDALRRKVDESGPANLTVELRGALPNADVQRIYRDEAVDWFMLLSRSEGLPIAVCEALAYGVPVIATVADEANGTGEVVTDDCGMPLPVDFTTEEAVRGLVPYLDSDIRSERLRRQALQVWREQLNASSLREQFVDMLCRKYL